jgi:ABC-type uncharacterized transport system involved in gliding motility auxiliary subunit
MSITARGATSGLVRFLWLGLVVAAILLLNLIAGRTTARIDLTRDGRFTLSEATVETAGSLPGSVQVEVFLSSNLPPALEQMRRDLNDLLAEYQAHSDGGLTYEFVDPDKSEEFAARASSLEIPSWPLEQRSENEISRRFVYAGVSFVYDDGEEERVQTIPQLLPGMNYEYELTRALRLVTRERGKATIGILVGDGGMFDQLVNVPMDPRQPRGREEMIAEYEEQLGLLFESLYDFRFVDLTERERVPEDIDGLFVIGPAAELGEGVQYALDQLVMSGRPVAFFVSPYRLEALNFDQPGFQNLSVPSDNPTGLGALLEAYGVQLRRDAIVDFDRAQVSAEQREVNLGGLRGTTWMPFLDPRLPELTKISETSLLVPNMNLLAFLPLERARPLSQSSLGLTAQARAAVESGALSVDHVLRTSDASFRLEARDVPRLASLSDADLEPFFRALEENPEAPDLEQERGPFTVAMTVEGRLSSAFPERADDEGHLGATLEGRVFVVSHGTWVQALLTGQDPLLGRGAMLPPAVRATVQQYHASNILLLRNTADWLAQESDLVRIRARGQASFFDSGALSEGEKRFFKLFNIAGVPAIFCFLGLCGFLIRQARREALRKRYGGWA